MLLAIDTSIGSSAAVVDDSGVVLSERSVSDTMRHAEVIGELIDGALRDAGVAAADITAVACGMGPGPFTGLRIGIAAARAFAFGRGIPVLPVVSHDAVAATWYADGGDGPLLVVTDARRRERYWSSYTAEAGSSRRQAGPGLAKPDGLPAADGARIDAESVSAGALGRVAVVLRAAGELPADEALYLRSPDVTLSAGPKRVTA